MLNARLYSCDNIGILKRSPNLISAMIDNCNTDYIDMADFSSLTKLTCLILQRGKLTELGDEQFSKMPTLKTLELRNNSIVRISVGAFKGIPEHLVRLNLINCSPLKELHMESAETVNLRDTWIRRLDIDGGVNSLFLRKNRLEHIQIEDKLAVTLMDLNDNLLRTEDLQNILMGMWRLQFLDLSCNLISELPVPKRDNSSEVFLLPSLQFLNLSFNMLEYLHGDSPLISPGLRKLDLSHNSIRIIDPHIFRTVNNLQSLHIEWNSIRNFRYDRFYSQHRGLKELALYANVFSNKTYSIITKFFKDAGVKVIEKIYDSRVLPESESFTESEDSTEVSLQL
uniref:Leucine-rich repeat-containing G-protein coupled receptor 5-like n=1 Tax=Drosophila rhopaloa TaxID=1041015 RepID=A0A6P4DZE9_DRORH